VTYLLRSRCSVKTRNAQQRIQEVPEKSHLGLPQKQDQGAGGFPLPTLPKYTLPSSSSSYLRAIGRRTRQRFNLSVSILSSKSTRENKANEVGALRWRNSLTQFGLYKHRGDLELDYN